MIKIINDFQTSVAKLLNVYRYNFPDTTIIMANPTLRIYWSGVSILEAGLGMVSYFQAKLLESASCDQKTKV